MPQFSTRENHHPPIVGGNVCAGQEDFMGQLPGIGFELNGSDLQICKISAQVCLDKSRLYVYTYFMSQISPPFDPPPDSGLHDSGLHDISLDFSSDLNWKELLNELSQIPTVCMGMHVRRASRIVTQVYDAALRPVGLVLSQFTLLVSIYLVGPVPITQLAQELFTDQTTLTRNIKLLEKRELVAIAPGVDRRIKLVSLTPQGQALLAQAIPLWKQAQAEIMQQFEPHNWQVLLSLLSEFKRLG
jgi:DNA-binding MarR family transcriptional regulator